MDYLGGLEPLFDTPLSNYMLLLATSLFELPFALELITKGFILKFGFKTIKLYVINVIGFIPIYKLCERLDLTLTID